MESVVFVLGLAFGAGLFLLLAAFRSTSLYIRWHARFTRRDLLIASGTGSAVSILTGWPVGAVMAAVLVHMARGFFRGRTASTQRIERTEAVAAWIERVRDNRSAGLRRAILASASNPVGPLERELRLLAADLLHPVGPDAGVEAALRRFAVEVGDPTVDLAVTAIAFAYREYGGELRGTLDRLADFARAEAVSQRRIVAGFARARTGARTIMITVLTMVTGLVAFSRDFLGSYDSVRGQLVLLVVGLVFCFALSRLNRLTRLPTVERFLLQPARLSMRTVD